MSEKKDFAAYEYCEVMVDERLMSAYVDGYQNFGWEIAETAPGRPGKAEVVLRMKRERSTVNKAELMRLQRNFEADMKEIAKMEVSKTAEAMARALAVGLGGTVFLAIATFSYLGGLWFLMILFAVPGFLGWLYAYPLYLRTNRSKTAELNPLIDQKYEEAFAACEKGYKLR